MGVPENDAVFRVLSCGQRLLIHPSEPGAPCSHTHHAYTFPLQKHYHNLKPVYTGVLSVEECTECIGQHSSSAQRIRHVSARYESSTLYYHRERTEYLVPGIQSTSSITITHAFLALPISSKLKASKLRWPLQISRYSSSSSSIVYCDTKLIQCSKLVRPTGYTATWHCGCCAFFLVNRQGYRYPVWRTRYQVRVHSRSLAIVYVPMLLLYWSVSVAYERRAREKAACLSCFTLLYIDIYCCTQRPINEPPSILYARWFSTPYKNMILNFLTLLKCFTSTLYY